MNNWISVEERMPEGCSKNYLVYRPDANRATQVCSLWFDPIHNGWSGNYKVTHWMPLPEPPK